MLEAVKSNLDKSRKIVKELLALAATYEETKSVSDKGIIKDSYKALVNQLEMLIEPLGPVTQSVSIEMLPEKLKPRKKLRAPRPPKVLAKYTRITTERGPVYISKEKKKRFMEEIGLGKKALRGIKSKIKEIKEVEPVAIRKPPFFTALASKLFYNLSSSVSKGPMFKSLNHNLRKANLPFVLKTYISIIFFITFCTFIVSLIIGLVVGFTKSPAWAVAIVVILTAISFFLTLSWPASIASSKRKKIETELAFATSHMAAIASSKIEPSKIFSIMALAREYPSFSVEIKKIVNQVNIYGYDLSTALKNVAKVTPSKKLGGLLNGMAVTITTGGNLTTYLKEKSKSMLLDYRLTRQRFSTIIGMYSDIYTALLIAAPLIFMLLLAVMSVLGTRFMGMPLSVIANLGIGAIVALNIIFIIFLNLTQPEI